MNTDRNLFVLGDLVYLRPSSGKCDVEWSGPFRVTRLFSSVSLEVNDDSIRRHVSNV